MALVVDGVIGTPDEAAPYAVPFELVDSLDRDEPADEIDDAEIADEDVFLRGETCSGRSAWSW